MNLYDAVRTPAETVYTRTLPLPREDIIAPVAEEEELIRRANALFDGYVEQLERNEGLYKSMKTEIFKTAGDILQNG